MPASAKLVKKLQETLGDEATHDLLVWLEENQRMNRAEVRELADVYLARFDERLERRRAELQSDVRSGEARLREEMKSELSKLREEVRSGDGKLREELRSEVGKLREEMTEGFAALRVEMADRQQSTVRWMLAFWVGTVVPLGGLMVVLVRMVGSGG
jgi:hypothetical protein